MSEHQVVKDLLAKLAEELDAPGGPGSGAVCLDAIAALDDLEGRCLPPASLPPERPG